MKRKQIITGIDVGGTFTDIVSVDEEGNTHTEKTPSTPADVSIGVMSAAEKMAGVFGRGVDEFISDTARFVYGTTVATNALLQRKGLDTAFITTRGFRDSLNLRRTWREGVLDIRHDPPIPIVPRDRCYEVTERIDMYGNIIQPLVEAEVKPIAEELKEANIGSVAVCLLFSFANPAHEQRIMEILTAEIPNIRVSLSSVVCPEVREYERASTTVINAYLAGTVGEHLLGLENELGKSGLISAVEIMQSSGGVSTTSFIMDRPVNIFLSGPAGGAMAGAFLAEHMEGRRNLLTVDMGGTSFDVCILPEGLPLTTIERRVHGWTILSPMVDINTIGAGGGSIAWVDVGGGLHVGPESAGAVPGPTCYMRGGEEATVTDADLLLGYLNPDYFLGGEMKISPQKAEEDIKKIGDKIGLSPIETADGIFRIVNNNMLGAMRLVTVERGYDPRDYSLVAFGGAGAVHASAMAEELGVKDIIVPMDAGALSAFGLTSTDIRYDFARNLNRNIKDMSFDELLSEYDALKQQGITHLAASGTKPENMYFERRADMKFHGQYREKLVNIPPTVSSMEDVGHIYTDLHMRLYGYVEEESPEITNLRLSAYGRVPKPRVARASLEGESCESAMKARRNAYFYEEGKSILTAIYDGRRIRPGNILQGPAIIELPTTTIVVRPGQSMFMDEMFNFNIRF